MMKENLPAKPWYKEPWAWFVAAPLIAVLISCSITVTIAFRMADDRVSDNYYKEGRMLSQEFTSDEYAKARGIEAKLEFNPQASEVTVDVSAFDQHDLENVVELSLFVSHPAQQAKDFTLVLTPRSLSTFGAELPQSLSGRWYLRLQGVGLDDLELWRLHGEIDFNKQHSIQL